MKKLNIIITGGAGFIGTHLYNQLKETHNVYRIDNFKTSNEENTKDVYNIDLGDLTDNVMIETIVAKADIVYHFASSIGVDLIGENPNETLQNSFNINNNLFPLFEKHQPKVIYASTSEVYGSSDTPMKETDMLTIGAPDQMRWGYACQKLMSEFLIKTYTFPFTVVRFFNVTGPGQLPNYGMVLPRFVMAAKTQEDIEVYGSGEQVRSFCDIRDAVNVLELLITEMNGEILNIGNDNNTITMNELASLVGKVSGDFHRIVSIPDARTNAEITSRIPDISKMRTIYEPKYGLEKLIMSMFE